MPLMKVCVPCCAGVHVRKSVCACGHVFASIKSSPLVTKTSKRVAIDRRRSLESEDEIAARKAKTALEKQRNVPQGTLQSDRARAAKNRAFETQEVERNRDTCAAKKESF